MYDVRYASPSGSSIVTRALGIVNQTTCLIKEVLEMDSLPHIKNVSEGSERNMPKTLSEGAEMLPTFGRGRR